MQKVPFLRPALPLLAALSAALPALAQDTQDAAQPMRPVGSVYLQTNGVDNAIIRYGRHANGSLVELERIPTRGKGSGTFKPITGQESAPNAFEGVGSVLLSPDHRLLFATNGGDNTVSSFQVAPDGKLSLLDVQPTGQPVRGRSGTAKSLAYSPRTRTLYVGHSFGPDHIHLFEVKAGKLIRHRAQYSVNTRAKSDRVPTQIVISPDNKYLLADILFDKRPGTKPDGSPDLSVGNMKDKDGLAVFPIRPNGELGKPRFVDAGGAGPFCIAFLHGSADTFVNSFAAGDGLSLSRISRSGQVTNSPIVKINAAKGMPSELCWVAITPDNRQVLGTAFGLSTVSSYSLARGALRLAQDPAAPAVAGDGKFKALNMVVSSGPSDSLLSPDGKCFYQIYPNASKLVAYQLGADGALTEIDSEEIPYNSPQGLAGF